MRDSLEPIWQLKGSPETPSVRRATRRRLGDFHETGNRLTGGGLRSLAKWQVGCLRDAGNRLTGGGLRALAKRVLTALLRRAMSQPALKALGSSVLQPFPRLSQRLYRLATASDTVPTTSEIANTTSPGPAQAKDHSLLVHSLYKTAFGRLADESVLASHIRELQSGTPLEILAEHLAGSPEFEMRHGSSHEVDIAYVTAMYRDGLGRPPELETLAFWLAQGHEGTIRAKVLAGVAGSEEALARANSATPVAGMDYNRWVAAFDTLSGADRAAINAHIGALPFRPVISVVMPVGKICEAALRESLNTVVAQLYPYWELCISVNTPVDPSLNTILRDATGRDLRIRLTEQSTADGVAGASNAGLKLATGDFVAFLRAGDTLPENALYEVAFALGGSELADIVYTDFDHINSDGQRTDPWFKPGWDPDLLLGQDYINHLAVYRRTLVKAVGCLRHEFEGAEFHDLALRATAATTPDRLLHVPAILYHKREGNKAINSEGALVELRTFDASRRAVRNYLHSSGHTNALVSGAPQIPSAIRVVWPLPTPEPLVSVIIPTRDRAELLAQCVEGLLHRTSYSNLELLIVDNESIEPTTFTLFDRLTREDSRVRILHHPGPFNYSALNNAAARGAKGEVLLLLNNDVSVIESGWLRELVSQALRPDVGVVGAKLLYINEQVQHGGIVLGPEGAIVHVHRRAGRNNPGYFGQLALPRTLSAVTGACAAVRRAVFFEVGGLDETNLPISFNDIDFCLRVGDHGYRVVWTPFAELFHLESASRGDDTDPLRRARFLREWGYVRRTWSGLLECADPFHNPNLLFSWESFEIPVSPRRRKPWRDLGEQMLKFQRHFSRAQISSNGTRAAQTE